MKKPYLFIAIFISSLQFTITENIKGQISCAGYLQHYWKFEENSLNTFHDYAGSLNAMVNIIPTRVTGIVGYAQYFDGLSEASIPDDNSFDWSATSSFSIEFWLNKSSSCPSQTTADNNVILGRDDANTQLHWWAGISCTSPGRINFDLIANNGSEQNLVSNQGVIDGNWHHIAIVRNGSIGTTSIYIDGARDTTVSYTFTGDFASSVPINIGWLNLNAKYHYNGSLDELALYNRALSAAEILDHHNSGNGISYCSQPDTTLAPVKIMPLGNSITVGEIDGIIPESQMKGYRYDLKQLLQISGIKIDFVGSQSSGSDYFTDSQHAGIGGSRDQYVVRLLTDGYDERNDVQILVPPRTYLDEYNPDIILLHIGTNDITHETDVIANQQVSAILDLIDQYEIRVNKEVIVFLGLIINRKLPCLDSKCQTTTDFNNAIKTMALARIAAGDNIVIVDMEHDAFFLYDDTDMEDLLHPNTLGYQKMALGWFNKMTEILPQISYKPEIKISPIDTGSVNEAYNSRIFAIGNPAPSYSLISAPTGMTIDPITGSISWTPLSIGNYSVSVLVSNTHGSDTASWILRITEIGFNHCNETFTALTGTITDNSGGASYDNNMSCQKLIQPVNAASITLTFNSFATESGYDFVSIYDGATTSSPLLGRYSGTTIPPALTSTGGTMLIVFTSDYSVVAAGWSASYTSSDEYMGTCTNETFTDATGTITDNSGGASYDNNMSCQKLIQPVNAASITLSFNSFATESGYDFVSIYDGATTSSPLLGRYSGATIPPALTSTGGTMLIVFTSDYSVVAAGWSAAYTSSDEYVGTCTNETFTDATGTITDNSGGANYYNNMSCQKLIQPVNAASITLTFNSFATESGYDFVSIYDGATTSSPLLGRYSGATIPPALTSTGGTMLIVFTSDYSVVAAGWSAAYTSSDEYVGTCTNETFTDATGTITDNSGGASYDNNMSCQKLIQPVNAASITLTFNSFATESGYDFVSIYDGATTSSPLLGRYSGATIPPALTSTGGTMLIVFTSDYSVVAAGWSAAYTSSNEYVGTCTNETFADATGTITDNSGGANYYNNMSCQKLIQPVNAASITLTFNSFATESGYDFVSIYDGANTSSPLLGRYSGATIPPVLTSTGGTMLIVFTSDYSVVAAGWSASYTTTTTLSPLELNGTLKVAGLGSDATRKEPLLLAYPNPTSDILTVETTYKEVETLIIELSNASGQVMLNQRLEVINGKFDIDISDYEYGFYLLRITIDNAVHFVRVLKD